MRTRVVAGHTVAAIGAGDVSLARAAKRNIDATSVSRALHAAISAGFDVIDVAPDEDSEKLVGDAIRSLRVRDRAVAAFRVPAIAERLGIPTRDVLPERLPAKYVVDRVERALRATRLEVLPLVLVETRAAWRSSRAWPELLGTLARLVREGKLLATGAFVEAIEEDTASLVEDFETLALPFSLCERASLPVIEAALAKQRAVLARRPLAGGALAGAIGPGMQLPRTDDRLAIDPKALERIAVLAARLSAFVKQVPPAARSCDAAKQTLESVKRIDPVECETLAELALRAVIDRGVVALPRLHRSDHVITALLAGSAPVLSTSAQVFSILDED